MQKIILSFFCMSSIYLHAMVAPKIQQKDLTASDKIAHLVARISNEPLNQTWQDAITALEHDEAASKTMLATLFLTRINLLFLPWPIIWNILLLKKL